MKRIMTLVLAAGLTLGAVSQASAVDFKAKGQWIMGFGYVDTNFTPKVNDRKTNTGDNFAAVQRLRLQLDVVASEALSGTVYFEIGDQTWGHNGSGGQLGTDGVVVEVKRAYLDWIVPNTNLSIRMGLQGVAMPNVAGGSAILDDDVAALAATYRFNDSVSLTAAWMRAFNDNWPASNYHGSDASYLDNFDGFMLALPITGDGFHVTPWVAYAINGKNVEPSGPSAAQGLYGLNPVINPVWQPYHKTRDYTNMFFAGLPIAITAFDPLNIEVDINYGYSDGFGRYDVWDYRFADPNLANLPPNDPRRDAGRLRGDSQRSGWLVKALVEYKMNWGTPGIFAWYGSGDDGNQKNGSERMPYLSPCGNFTSFIGDGDINGWSIHNASWANMGYDQMMSYSGTWGIGAQIKNMSFLEGLKHTLRVAYWGGTNSPSMVKYIGSSTYATDSAAGGGIFYLTTHDGLLEVNLDSTWQIYDNLTATLELGYIANFVNKGTWERAFYQPFERGDAYKAALIFAYNF